VLRADWSLAKVTDFDARHVQIMIEDKIVLMRKEDCFLNATQILALTKKDSIKNERLLQRMEQILVLGSTSNTDEYSASILDWSRSCNR